MDVVVADEVVLADDVLEDEDEVVVCVGEQGTTVVLTNSLVVESEVVFSLSGQSLREAGQTVTVLTTLL